MVSEDVTGILKNLGLSIKSFLSLCIENYPFLMATSA